MRAGRTIFAALAILALMGTACNRTAQRKLAACEERYADADRLRAMIIVQTLAQAWTAVRSDHAETVLSPSQEEVGRALGLLRCDRDHAARARSRHVRAVAKLLSHDWGGERSTRPLLELGFPNVEALNDFKARVVSDVPPEAFALYAHDVEWLEYAVLRHVMTTGDVLGASKRAARGMLGPATAYAQGPPSCWQPEAKSTNDFIDPYVELTAHVSVSASKADAAKHVDAQRWNDCGTFWSPPDPANPSQPLDGARFVDPTWPTTPCKAPSPPLADDPSAPTPGSIFPTPHYLFEQFFSPLIVTNAHFENILAIWVFLAKRIAADGTELEAQHLSFRLGSCGNDQVVGALGGAIGSVRMKVVLDSGYIEVWSEGGRTHVASLKRAELSDRASNWLTQFNPALNELNDELGELACCLP